MCEPEFYREQTEQLRRTPWARRYPDPFVVMVVVNCVLALAAAVGVLVS